MVWTGGGGYRLAPALLTLFGQLRQAWPGQQWQNSPQTGTIGDAAHWAEGSASDHNPWLARTVRALDVAANTSGVPGIVTVTDAPNCEALFEMVNTMFGTHDPRVFPNGYAIYRGRITDWSRPGAYRATNASEDPHLYHLHISVSQNPDGFNSTAAWPLSNGGSTVNTVDQLGPVALGQIKGLLAADTLGEEAHIHADSAGTFERVANVLVPAVMQILQLEQNSPTVQAIAAEVAARVGTGQEGITLAQLATAFGDELERRIALAASAVAAAAATPPPVSGS